MRIRTPKAKDLCHSERVVTMLTPQQKRLLSAVCNNGDHKVSMSSILNMLVREYLADKDVKDE